MSGFINSATINQQVAHLVGSGYKRLFVQLFHQHYDNAKGEI